MRPTILLFDIDGTLVTTPGVGRRALDRAFLARYGRDAGLAGRSFLGRTDRAIVRAGLAAIEEAVIGDAAEAAIDAVLADYVVLLADEVARVEGFHLHPGVANALEAAAEHPRTALGLGTGNVREGARVKLERVGVDHLFGFGGFGCDHEDRGEILRLGAGRGAERLGVPLARCRVVVIGDTPLDVAAARAIAAESLAVATGRHAAEDLRESGATHVFDDLAAPGALSVLLGRA